MTDGDAGEGPRDDEADCGPDDGSDGQPNADADGDPDADADGQPDVETAGADLDAVADRDLDVGADEAGPGDRDGNPDAGGNPDDGDEAAGEDDEEVEPVELLVRLARNGEIAPWDIDIVAVTDKFLAALDEGDLRTTGRALFYASVLLRMKSDALMEADEEPEPEPEPWEAPLSGGDLPPEFDPVDAMEAEMDRRLDRKSARGTPETLDELVRDLREAERGSWWKESRSYDTSNSPRGFQRGVQTLDYRADDDTRMAHEPTEADVTGTAHEEDIEATIDAVRAALDEQYAAGRPEVLYGEIADAGGSRVETFLALLFLANRGVVRLAQDELFGDLWVRDARGLGDADEAVAD